MKNFQILHLNSALNNLDGYRDPKGQTIPFDFEPKANQAISKNLRIIDDHVKYLENTNERMRKQLRHLVPDGQKGITLSTSDPAFQKFQRDWIEVLNEDVELTLFRVHESHFKFDVNPVPLAVQKGLSLILLDDPLPAPESGLNGHDVLLGLPGGESSEADRGSSPTERN